MRAGGVDKLCLTQKMGLAKVGLEICKENSNSKNMLVTTDAKKVYNEVLRADGKSVINFAKGVWVKLVSVKNRYAVFNITNFLIKIKF